MRPLILAITLVVAAAACSGDPSEPAGSTTGVPTSAGPAGSSTSIPRTAPTTTAATTSTSPGWDPDFVLRIAVDTRVDMRSNPFASPDLGAYPRSVGAHLYRVLPASGTLVPELAASDSPPAGEQQGETWSIQVVLNEGITWSDGEPVDAFDIEYTFQELSRLGDAASLGWQVADPGGSADLLSVDALDRRTVEFLFTARPDLDRWQFGISTATIIPEHYWVFTFSDRAPGRETDPDLGLDAPSAGAYRFAETAGGIWAFTAVDDWWNSGAEYTVWADGAIHYRNARIGLDEEYGGEGRGDPVARWTEGPFAGRVEWWPVESGERSVASGDTDLFSGSGPARRSSQVVAALFGSGNGIFSEAGSRAALSCFLFPRATGSLLAAPSEPVIDGWGLGFWAEGAPPDPCPGSGADRLAAGISRSEALGWSWDDQPVWREPASLAQGRGLVDPEGRTIEVIVASPPASEDALASAAATRIAAWLAEAGFATSLTEADLATAGTGAYDLLVATIDSGSPPRLVIPLEPGLGRGYMLAGNPEAARIAWLRVAERIRQEALAVPVARLLIPGVPPRSVRLPYTPLFGETDLESVVSAVTAESD